MRVKEVENLVQVDEEKGGGKELLSCTTPPLWRFQSSCLSWPESFRLKVTPLNCFFCWNIKHFIPSQGCCGDRDCLDYSPAPRSLGLKEEQKGWTRGQISATTPANKIVDLSRESRIIVIIPDGRKVNQTCPSACSSAGLAEG